MNYFVSIKNIIKREICPRFLSIYTTDWYLIIDFLCLYENKQNYWCHRLIKAAGTGGRGGGFIAEVALLTLQVGASFYRIST